MALTNADVDTAVPVGGTPSRAQTNAAFKQLILDVAAAGGGIGPVDWYDDSTASYSAGTIDTTGSPWNGDAVEGQTCWAAYPSTPADGGKWTLGDVSDPAAVPVTRSADCPVGTAVYKGQMIRQTGAQGIGRAIWIEPWDSTYSSLQQTAIVGTDIPEGNLFVSQGYFATAIGATAQAIGESSIAVGDSAHAFGARSFALGHNAEAFNDDDGEIACANLHFSVSNLSRNGQPILTLADLFQSRHVQFDYGDIAEPGITLTDSRLRSLHVTRMAPGRTGERAELLTISLAGCSGIDTIWIDNSGHLTITLPATAPNLTSLILSIGGMTTGEADALLATVNSYGTSDGTMYVSGVPTDAGSNTDYLALQGRGWSMSFD